jgi:site-specific DNA-methyltransferase (adenine-specific)
MTNKQKQGLFSSATDEWATPQDLFDRYDAVYHFDLDPASTDENAKCEKHFTVADGGLHNNWGGYRVWLNPPYGRSIGDWVRKAYEESQKPDTVVVCLLPARTDTAWFHDYCAKGEIEFIRGRLRFGGSRWNAPFPSMIVIFGGRT